MTQLTVMKLKQILEAANHPSAVNAKYFMGEASLVWEAAQKEQLNEILHKRPHNDTNTEISR
jgi:hypothetical protein